MKQMNINDLPLYSAWPARLLGLTPFTFKERTRTKVLKEYDQEKFSALLEYFHSSSSKLNAEKMREFEWGDLGAETCYSRGQKLYVDSAGKILELERKLFISAFKALMPRCDTVVELGAGYGHNLALLEHVYPDKEFIGGEFSPNGVSLGRQILSQRKITMTQFDYFDSEWQLFNKLRGKRILVFTYHSVEMLKEARLFFEKLEVYKNDIVDILLFEPLYEVENSNTMLGLLRKKYIDANDYNRDLDSVISKTSGLTVIEHEDDYFGSNPLFAQAKLHLRFR